MPFRLLTPQEVSHKVAGRGARDFPVRHVGDGFGSTGPVRGGGGVRKVLELLSSHTDGPGLSYSCLGIFSEPQFSAKGTQSSPQASLKVTIKGNEMVRCSG